MTYEEHENWNRRKPRTEPKKPKTTTTTAQTHKKTCISLLGLPNRVPQTVWLYTTESYVSPFWKIEIWSQGVSRAILSLKKCWGNYYSVYIKWKSLLKDVDLIKFVKCHRLLSVNLKLSVKFSRMVVDDFNKSCFKEQSRSSKVHFCWLIIEWDFSGILILNGRQYCHCLRWDRCMQV